MTKWFTGAGVTDRQRNLFLDDGLLYNYTLLKGEHYALAKLAERLGAEAEYEVMAVIREEIAKVRNSMAKIVRQDRE
jgi:hypothetical protein